MEGSYQENFVVDLPVHIRHVKFQHEEPVVSLFHFSLDEKF
jgi:hypothetical protein